MFGGSRLVRLIDISEKFNHFQVQVGKYVSHQVCENRILNSNLLRYVESYRTFGHEKSNLDPLRLMVQNEINISPPQLFGLLNPNELYSTEGIMYFPNESTKATGKQIEDHLEETYCSNIGAEFQHIRSETFDEYLHKKYPTFKRYGLQGSESMIVAVDAIVSAAGKGEYENIIIGMPHRGRLNLLVTLMDYPAKAIFTKIEGNSIVPISLNSSDDVISHISHHMERTSPFRHSVTLLPNPSHLEAINAVSQGYTRASIDDNNSALCIQIHGDASFIGQGVVTESLMMNGLKDFSIQGTIHLIVNNQLGFTAGHEKMRSTAYSSDIAKAMNIPILHVNADNPESVLFASRLGFYYKNHFKKDIIIDLIGYRRLGHNEVDSPEFTQPSMYKQIKSHPTITNLYASQLTAQYLLTTEQISKLKSKLQHYLDSEYQSLQKYSTPYTLPITSFLYNKWLNYCQPINCHDQVFTGVKINVLQEILLNSVRVPEGFNIHPRLERSHVSHRKSMMDTNNIDWSTAESLALGSILNDGINVRMCGQDVERGTFSHRHGVLIDQLTGESYTPLAQSGYKGKINFVSSFLSEYGVLGYEYGYSIYSPHNVVIWEAQYGDFANTAQVMIDNFISNGEVKWVRPTGIVLLLPHGSDGLGAEHSSARIERYLQLSDEVTSISSNPDTHAVNLIIANPSTPAQYFHLLRRQIVRDYRKPLICISPKTLIRLNKAISSLSDMDSSTYFHPVLSDINVKAENVKTLVFLSGKVYYDLVEERDKRIQQSNYHIAFIRIEEICPFPWQLIKSELQKYSKKKKELKIIWFQEESENSGAFSYIKPRLQSLLNENEFFSRQELLYCGRNPSAVAAVGSLNEHKKEVRNIYESLFRLAA